MILVLLVGLAGTIVALYANRSDEASNVGRGLFLTPDLDGATLQAYLDHYAQLGVNHISLTADLYWLCPTSSCDFGRLRPVVDGASRRGMTISVQVNRMPEWLDSRGPTYGPATEGTRREWGRIVHQLAAYLGTRVEYYEIWNEPDSELFWAPMPDPEAYALLLRESYRQIKSADPTALVVGGNLSANNLGFLGAMYDTLDRTAGKAQARSENYFFDILGVHPYAGWSGVAYAPSERARHDESSPFGVIDRNYLGFRRMHALVNKRESRNKDLAFGEFGYSDTPSAHGAVPDRVRASWLKEAYQLAADAGYVRYLTWFVYSTTNDDDRGYAIVGTQTERALAALPRGSG